jgi:alcohol dehydrogenase (NADP+)
VLVPHAYAAGPDHSTLRQPNGKVGQTHIHFVVCAVDIIIKPLIDYELSRNYTKTWQAMESLVGKGKAKLIGTSCIQTFAAFALVDFA